MIDMLKRLWKPVERAQLMAATFVPIKPPGSAANDSLVNTLFSSNGGADLGAMLNVAFQVAINVGAILAMMRIMWAGWLYMGAADMWSNKHHAKEVFQNAIIGLLILLAIWIILHQINPQILQVGTLGSGAQTSSTQNQDTNVFTTNPNAPVVSPPIQNNDASIVSQADTAGSAYPRTVCWNSGCLKFQDRDKCIASAGAQFCP